MNKDRVRLLPAILLCISAGLILMGCTQGMLRPDGEDSTGSLGETRTEEQGTRSGDIYVQLAIAYMQSGQMDIALQQAKKALMVNPKNAAAHDVIALIYDRLGESQAAERHYKTAVGMEPQNSYILNAYGTFLCKQGRYEEAVAKFDAALANPLYRTPELAYTNAGICVGQEGDAQRSEDYLRKALETNPRFPTALVEMAKLKLQQGRYTSAREYVLRFSRASGHTAESLWVGIQAARKVGDWNMASSYLLQLNSNFPDSKEAQLARESQMR